MAVTANLFGLRLSGGLQLGLAAGVGLLLLATSLALLAIVISLGTTNAFVASVSRLGYALGRDGWLPSVTSRLNTRHTPYVSILIVGAIGASGLIMALVWKLGTEDLVTVPASLVLATYLIGMAAGIRLLGGRERALACLAFGLCALVTPFASAYVAVPVLVTAAALIYRYCHSRLARNRG